nr:hypothetical protein [Tanacetum cinerariifolium]
MAPTTLEKVNTRVTELAKLHEHDTHDLYALLEDAQDCRTRISYRVTMDSQRVDLLIGDRMTLQETIWIVDDEAYAAQEAWAHSVGLSQTVHHELQTLREQVNTCLMETDDSNVTLDSPDICEDGIQNDHNDVKSDDERVALANLIDNLKLDTKQTEFEKYKAFNDRTNDYDKLEHVLAELQCMYLHKVKECDCLAQKLSKQTESVSKKVKNDIVCNEKASNGFRKEREQYIKIQDLKAKLIPKPSVLGKPAPFSNALDRIYFPKTMSVSKANVSGCLSKPVTIQTLPQTARQAVSNTNVLKPGMYRINNRTSHTRALQLPQTVRNTNPRMSISTGVNHNSNVSIPHHKSNQSTNKVLPNNSQVKAKKTKVEVHPRISSISNKMKSVTACKDSLNSRTLNANAVCATCNKCLVDSNHFACVTKMLNDVHARTKKPTVVPISTRKPKSQANKSVATPHKKKIKHSKDLFRAPTVLDMKILIQTCLMPLAIKTQNDSLKFVHELKQEMHADLKYVESLEKGIDELESEKAEFSDMYDVILQDCVSKDVMCSYLMSLSDLDVLDELQYKNIAISELKKLIENGKGKSVDTKFDRPSVVRQPNAQRIPKPLVLGKPTPFSNSLDRIYFQKTESVPKANVSEGLSKPVTTQTLPQTVKKAIVQLILFIVDSGCTKHMTGNLKLLCNFVEKFLGLNQNLFSVGQFCDTDLEVAFRKSTCFVRDLQGNDLLTEGYVIGLPKLKYVKDQLCSSCELSKAKRSSFKSKAVPSSNGSLNLLHLDLCGPMRVASINEKISHNDSKKSSSPVITVRTDRGTEFLNKTLNAFFKEEGIQHQTSTSRTPEQNGVVKRQNRTLVEAARTMLSASQLPLFFWAEAIATACYTQNRSIIIPTHDKTPYHIINDRKPSIKHLHIFGCICHITRDGENLDKIKEKGDQCILVGYSTQSKGYRVYNKRTRMIVESIHIRFDEIKEVSETQDVYSSADADVPSQQELNMLFGPLYEFFNAGSNPSTNIQSTSAPSTHTNVHAEENNNDQENKGEYFPTFNQPQVFEYQWTKDHPLEQVRGNPSRPVQTIRQLATDPEMYMYALTVSTTEPKNIKEAMANSAWIEST